MDKPNTDLEPITATPHMRKLMLERLAATGGMHLAPLVNALGTRMALMILPACKQRFAAPKGRPWVALIGDDLSRADGPSAFHVRSLRDLLAKAHAVTVISGEAVPSAYAAAADGAQAGLNTAIIETRPTEEASWVSFVFKHSPKSVKMLVTPNAKAWRKAA